MFALHRRVPDEETFLLTASHAPSDGKMAPTQTIETVTIVRPLKVIAFICGLIVLLLMALALASSDWLISDGWRQGLFAHCTEEDAGRPLPFDLPFEPGCHRARDVAYIIVSEALAICCMLLDAFATLMAGLGLWSKDTNKKYRYYRAAVYVMIVALISILIALVVYPVCFAQELEQSYQQNNIAGNRTVWEFGWAYGVGWGAAIFLFGGVILLLCDKESEEIYYKERTILHDDRASSA
ncbi:transmembrane protein 47-like isoform X5 [Amphibalanus amphitrite]|uniref:transmembrane protein 47-like isoform X5 n=1 Tax=Amphibalanus amphitrite TaxID=1232801 RepID=UPI001C928274|nr:transmembrane protein 47-like isoform X5 [Amphibalanus amphitrite]